MTKMLAGEGGLTSALSNCVEVLFHFAAVVLALFDINHFGRGWGQNLLQVRVGWLLGGRCHEHLKCSGRKIEIIYEK